MRAGEGGGLDRPNLRPQTEPSIALGGSLGPERKVRVGKGDERCRPGSLCPPLFPRAGLAAAVLFLSGCKR